VLPTKFQFIWPSSFREEDLKKSTNQKQELPMTAMFVKVGTFRSYSLTNMAATGNSGF
jgi:hypothetical protein